MPHIWLSMFLWWTLRDATSISLILFLSFYKRLLHSITVIGQSDQLKWLARDAAQHGIFFCGATSGLSFCCLLSIFYQAAVTYQWIIPGHRIPVKKNWMVQKPLSCWTGWMFQVHAIQIPSLDFFFFLFHKFVLYLIYLMLSGYHLCWYSKIYLLFPSQWTNISQISPPYTVDLVSYSVE